MPFDVEVLVPPSWDGVDLIYRRRRMSKRVKADTLMKCTYWYMVYYAVISYYYRFCVYLLYASYMPGMRSDDVCLIVGFDVTMLTWFNLLHQPHAHTR